MQKAVPAETAPLAIIVDDDEGMRESVGEILRSVGIQSIGFGSTADLFTSPFPDRPGCLILDVRLPGLSGLELQAKLASSGSRKPIIFMSGYGDVPMTVRAMKAGALDFLQKPFRDQDIIDAVMAAIEKDQEQRSQSSTIMEVAELVTTLTPRERQVMAAVVRGLLNKQIAHELQLSEITVKIHRGNVMRKMKSGSVADLVRKAELLKTA